MDRAEIASACSPRVGCALAMAAAAALALAPAPSAHAVGDLEFLSRAGVPPNVMLILDNSGSMRSNIGSQDRIEIAGDTLVNLVNSINPDDGAGGYWERARFGLARFPTGASAHGGIAGSSYWNGCVGATVVEPISSGNKADVVSEIQQTVTDVMEPNKINADGTCLSETLLDVGRYLGGGTGFPGYPTDLTLDRTLPLWVEPNPKTWTTKTMEPICDGACPSPMDFECRQNFVILITDGLTQGDLHDHYGSPDPGSPSYTTYLNAVGNADGDFNECDPNTASAADCTDQPETGRDDGDDYGSMGTDWLDDVAWHMSHTDFAPSLAGTQKIVTYTIGFDVADYPLLSEAGAAGGGDSFNADDAGGLQTALEDAFAGIFEQTRASFSSAVVSSRHTSAGSAFLNAFFESSDAPVWAGHLEMYRLAPSGAIQGLNGGGSFVPAVDANGNLIEPHKKLWDAGEKLATNASRNLLTASASFAAAPVTFNTTNVTVANLGISAADFTLYPNHPASGVDTVAELHTALVDYTRGRDAFDEDGDSSKTDLRPVVLGDIFHSTPLVVGPPRRYLQSEDGYASFLSTYEHRDRIVYVGANDGVFHAFDAGGYVAGDDARTTDVIENGYYSFGTGASEVNGGKEIFGYVPRSLLGKLKQLPINSPRTQYFVDGSPIAADAWLADTNSNKQKDAAEWATVAITGFREGGDGYVALDVTDPSGTQAGHTPYPKLLWEFSHARLGESWSTPVISRVRVRESVGYGDHCGPDDGDGDCREQWVAIFGGGYAADGDPNRTSYVSNPADASWSDRSKAIFMVALDTGQVLASVEFDASDTNGPDDMLYSLPSSPAVLDLDFDGFADVVYIGDLGGQLWKWTVDAIGANTTGDARIDNWPAGIFFATPGTSMGGGITHYRSFFEPPAASFRRGQLILAFASGERHDLSYPGDATRSENNRVYVARDTAPSAFASTLSESDLTDITNLDADNDSTDEGYYFQVADSEKFVAPIQVVAGSLAAASYTPVPSADLCATASGQAFLYPLDLATGAALYPDPIDPPSEDRRVAIGGGLPSTPRVTLGGQPSDDRMLIKTSDGRIQSLAAPPRTTPNASFIYWRELN